SPYRAGYLPEERRRIERQLFEGELLAAVATTALELGVDIGALDATVLTGYPGSIASTWQQAGRSGRRRERALTFLIGQDNPLDQYFMRHPEFFFGKSHENALTSPDNLHILKPHLLCAAWEIPLREGEGGLFGENYLEAAVELEKAALLRKNGKRWYPASSEAYPAEGIAIRGTSMHGYALVEAGSGRLLETIEEATAFFEIYPGAIYLHHGEPYLVTKLDVEGHTAYCVVSDAPYYTQTKEVADLKILKTVGTKSAGTVTVYLGEVDVTTTVVGFKRRRVFTEEVIGEEPLELPPLSIRTTAFWFDLPPKTDGRLAVLGLDFAGGLHAAEHASIGLLPLFALCDRNDIGGVSTPLHQDTGQAQVFIHDAHPGGTGIAEKGYQLAEELWEATLKVVSECPCEDGCPGCVQSPKCGNNNEPLDKKAAREILNWLLKPGQGQPKSSGS
ncbi:MAG: DUF1998 domain-containing protein, partial [Chloroflexi bacterium]|nr:DUF1998 domain-containing protein [Chloroflexota bacterium]